MSTEREEEQLVETLGKWQLKKLRQNRHKPMWRTAEDPMDLLDLAYEEMTELYDAITSNDASVDVWKEAADVANLAAMAADAYTWQRFIEASEAR